MLDLIEKIGPYVGLGAFIGLAVLAFVIFQQSRDVRRLRDWAGRAPERANEAAEASQAASDARGEAGEPGPGRLARMRTSVAGAVGPRYRSFDRRLPIDGRIVLGVLAAGLIAAGVLTSGFGLVGDGGGGGERGSRAERRAAAREERPKVAVLNATQTSSGVQGVPGLAKKVATEVVKPAGYPVGTQADAPAGFAESTVMFEPDQEGAAAEFARAIESKLGQTNTQPIAADIQDSAGDASLVLVIGADDADF